MGLFGEIAEQHRDLVGHAVVEAVLQRVAALVVAVRDVVVGLDAHLHVLRSGHVGQRRAVPRRERVHLIPEHRAVGEVRDRGNHVREVAALIDDAHRRAVEAFTRIAVVGHNRAEAGFDEEPIREGRRIGGLIGADVVDVLRPVLRLRRRRGAAAAGAVAAHVLLVPEEIELLARRDLPRRAQRRAVPQPVGERLLAIVRVVNPRVRVAGVLVVVHAGHITVGALITSGQVEPEPVLHDRPAERAVHVPQLLQLSRFAQPGGHQLVVEVAALQRSICSVQEHRAAERVAASPRHNVDHRPAGFGFAETASDVDRDFRDVLGVGDVERATTARSVHTKTIHVESTFGVGAAVTTHVQRGGAIDAAHVLRIADRQPRYQHDEVVVGPLAWDGVNGLVIDDALLLDALHIDDGAFAGDGQGLFQRSDAHLDVDGRGQRTGQFDRLALHDVETGQRESDRVSTWIQRDDPVASGLVTHRAAAFLDEHRARRLDGDTRQHGAGGVAHHAGNRCLDGALRVGARTPQAERAQNDSDERQ